MPVARLLNPLSITKTIFFRMLLVSFKSVVMVYTRKTAHYALSKYLWACLLVYAISRHSQVEFRLLARIYSGQQKKILIINK